MPRTLRVRASWSGVTAVYMPSSARPNSGKRWKFAAFSASICARDLLDRGIGPEPADVEKAVASARVVRPLRRGEGERYPELDLVTWAPRVAVVAEVEEREPTRHHADDGIALPRPTQSKVLSDDRRITTIESLPEPVAQDDLLFGADLTLGVGKRPAQSRRDLQQAKQRRCRFHSTDFF